jgi:transcriptional regulator with XRE-family HTH domain
VRATLEEPFYNVDVTAEEMWQAVGVALQRARLERRWHLTDVERAGGPSYKTVQAIENGDAGTVESLAKCAQALNLSIVDILYEVLASKTTALSPEAAQVVRQFAQTTVAGRTAMLAMANALPPAAVTAGPPPIPGAEAAPPTPRRRRPAPRAAKRRTAR